LLILIVLGEEYKLWNSSSYSIRVHCSGNVIHIRSLVPLYLYSFLLILGF
jgi:hypothetical protein